MSSYQTKKTPGDTAWFTHDRFGMFIHWGLYRETSLLLPFRPMPSVGADSISARPGSNSTPGHRP